LHWEMDLQIEDKTVFIGSGYKDFII